MTLEELLREERAEGKAEGKAEGRAEGKAEGRAEGKAEGILEGQIRGQAESILLLLSLLGSIPQHISECICQEKNPDILSRWLRSAARADSVEAFIKSM